jgi:predicted nucleic acid-binding protein
LPAVRLAQVGFISKEEAEDFLKEAIHHGYRISQKLIKGMFRDK